MSSKKRPGRADAFRKVLGFTFRQWGRQPWRAAAISGGMTAATVADLLVPLFAGRLIDSITLGATDRPAALDGVVLALAGILVLNGLAVLFRHLAFMGIIGFTLVMMRAVLEETFARVQRFSADWHANNFAGSTVRKITRGAWAIDLLNDTIVLSLLPSVVVLVGSSVLLAIHWPVMGLLVAIGSVGFIALSLALSMRVTAPAARLSNAWDTRLGGFIADSISSNPVVKGFGGELREEAQLSGVLAKWQKRTHRTWTFGTWSGTGQLATLTLLRTAVLAFAAWLWWQGRASAGDVTFVLTTYGVVHGYLRDIGQHVRNLQRSVNDMEELVEFHREPFGVADRPDAEALAVSKGQIAFENVTFHYGNHAAPLYRDLTVTIEGGERVALVGHSGSGKTTFVKLIQRLYDVSGGRVAIDGQDVAGVTQASLRQQIAIVQQEPVLFHRSLAENIAYARPGASMEEIVTAARLANAHGFIERLPKGYATTVGERGVKLSGGERQRVAIARAFLANAPILILDEATSSLDAESEAAVQEAIERLMKGRTTIVIAHRLSTVRAMDRLLVFDRGRVVEQGDHETLMRKEDGIYKKLFLRQMAAMADELAA